jgi:hypothetical protein
MKVTPLHELNAATGLFQVRTLLLVPGAKGTSICWIADDLSSFAEGQRREVVVPAVFLESLRSTFPPYGGGRIVYAEECEMEVEFRNGGIVCIHSIVARRDDLQVTWKAVP